MGMSDNYTEQHVPLDRIVIDGDTQMRVKINDEAVADYKAKYEAGQEPERLPIVYFDGSTYWPADGHHRYMAKLAMKAATMLCEVRLGTKRDAVLCAMEINLDHGVRMTHDDKVRSARVLLQDDEWGQWSDRNIADKSGLSPTTVGKLRRDLAAATDGPSVHGGQMRTAIKGGKTIKINTAAIGKSKPASPLVAAVQAIQQAGAELKHTGPMHDPADFTQPLQGDALAANVAARNQLIHDNYPAYAAAHHKWAIGVRDQVYELVLRDDTGGRLLAVVGLDLGDVGQALGDFDCDTVEAGRKIVGENADQLVEAFACSRIGPVPLFARLLDDRVGKMLTLFDHDADVTSLSPLFVALAEGWGSAVPPEPQPDDFKPKAKAAKKPLRTKDEPAADKAVGGGYGPDHPWYYKLGGRRLAVSEIEAADLNDSVTLSLWKLPKAGPKRVAKIKVLLDEAVASVARDAKRYMNLVERGWDAVTDPPYMHHKDDPASCSALDTSLSLTHNHVCHGKGQVALLEKLLAECGGVAATDVAPVGGQASLAIPDKPEGQASTWHQWTGRTAQACQTLGLDVEQILPTEFAVGLYREGLKPKQAALRYVDQHKPPAAPKVEAEDVDLGEGQPIAADVLAELRKATCTNKSVALSGERIHRSLYTRVNKVLELLGGKWSKSFQTHIFETDPKPVLAAAIKSGRIVDRKQTLAFFETPESLADRVAELAEVTDDHVILEPSAGTGQLVRAALAKAMRAQVTAVEIDPYHADALSGICDDVLRGDFLTIGMDGYGPFDRVIANPPYLGRTWQKHVDRMIDLLKPGGRLVCVLPWTAKVQWASNADWSERLNARCTLTEFEDVPAGTFKAAGSKVNTCILIAHKKGEGVNHA